jgi:carboxypeptidase D
MMLRPESKLMGQGAAHLIQFLQNLYHIFPELSSVDVSLLAGRQLFQEVPS